MGPMNAFDHAAANARPECPRCGGTGQYQFTTHGTPKFTICNLCCKHDRGWWQLSEHHSQPGKWCCRAGCGYVSPTDPPEDERWHHADDGWVKGSLMGDRQPQ